MNGARADGKAAAPAQYGLVDTADRTPHRRPHAPQRPEIGFRLGRQSQLHHWMTFKLRASAAAPPQPGDAPIRAREPSFADTSGFVDALLSAWSAVGDNLTFYQERIAQEGYLRTATEAFSVRALLAGLGYAPAPATSASTDLAFTLLDARGAPTSVTIPGGLGVQSLPSGGQPAVVFETNAAIEARPEWNAIRISVVPSEAASPIADSETTRLQVVGGRQLQPGMALVVQDPSIPDAAPQVRLLTGVDAQNDGTTWLSWRGALQALKPGAGAPAVYVCTRSGRLFGDAALPWSGLPDAIKARYGTRRGTVAQSTDGGETWTSIADGLPPGDVRAAAMDSDGSLYICVDDTVLRRTSSGGWIVAGTPSPRSDIYVLRAGAHERLYAGVARGEVMVSSDSGRNWSPLTAPTGEPISHGALPRLPQSPVLDILLLNDSRTSVAVATNVGVWTAPPGGGEWTAWNEGLPGGAASARPGATAVRALFKTKHGGVVAATEAGLFHAVGPGAKWRLSSPEEAFAICETPWGELAAATSNGVLLSSDQGVHWRRSDPLLAEAIPITRVVPGHNNLIAGGPSGVFAIERNGSWRPLAAPPMSGSPGAALFDLGGQSLVVSEQFQGYAEHEWPGFSPAPGDGAILDLDRAYPGVAPGGWAVLMPDRLTFDTAPVSSEAEANAKPTDEAQGAVALAIQDCSLAARSDFGLSGRVTRLRVSRLPAGIDPRTTNVQVSSTVLDLVPTLMVKPRRLEGLGVSIDDGVGSTSVDPIRLDGDFTDVAGRQVAITGHPPGAASFSKTALPTAPGDASTLAEVAKVVSATLSSDSLTTEICFSAALANVYDVATVTINANVVSASHGETPVSAEVLGNGDNGTPNQSFALKGKPLSTPDPSRRAAGDPLHAIEVRIRTGSPNDTLSLAAQLLPSDLRATGQLWREVPSFDKSGPLDLHYRVSEAIDGSMRVMFGDGRNGRRLPTGFQNVVALYRVGAGAAGNVGPGQITLPKQKPAGVKSVTNPVAATGGVDAQDIKQTRAAGPIQARALSRIVSARDFEGFALTRPSIAKSLGTDRAAAGGASGVLLTLATSADSRLSPGGAASAGGLAELEADIKAATARRPALTLARSRLVWFDLEAELTLAPEVVLSAATTLKVAQALIEDTFNFANQTLGAPVRAAAVIAWLQAVPGVGSARLISLHRHNEPPTLMTRIEAAPASMQAGKVLGAELLLLASAKIAICEVATSPIARGRE